MRHVAIRVAILVACASGAACAGAIVRPGLPAARPATDALLVLPGFGYTRGGEKALRSLAPAMAAEGIDLFVPTYISRAGIARSRANLQQFITDHQLGRYAHLHVFAFLAGAWTFNPLVAVADLPNLTTVVYDRSPYQERAPKIADERVHLLTWLRYGTPVFDVARTPYAPLTKPDVSTGIMVETIPTSFIRHHAQAARDEGPFHFACEAFTQRYDDCVYLALKHDEIYGRFAEVWPEVLAFIQTGRFSRDADRTPPTGDAMAKTEDAGARLSSHVQP